MQNMIFVFLGITICLIVLFFSGKSLVKLSTDIARKLGVSDIFIGTTLIALTTGIPTLLVSLIAFLTNQTDVALGNLIGTNYVNIGLALGIPAFMTTILVKREAFEKQIPLYFSLMALFTSFVLDNNLSQLEGIILLIFLIAAWGIIIQYGISSHKELEEKQTITVGNTKIRTMEILSILFVFLVILGSSFGISYLTPFLVEYTGISSYILGLTLVGVGTSIPTIAAGIAAARAGNTDLVIGNVFGGNILNVTLGIGLLAILKPFEINPAVTNDLLFVNIYGAIIVILILAEMKLLGKNNTLSKISGLIMIITYFVYLTILIF